MTHTDVKMKDVFEAVLRGDVNCEIRKIKAPVTGGDRLIYQEIDEKKAFTGREVTLNVTKSFTKERGLQQGFALVCFRLSGDVNTAVTTTAIPAEAQVAAAIDTAPPADLEIKEKEVANG